MALRFQSKAAQIAQGGTTFNHGLAAIPDEYSVVLVGPSPGAAVLYVSPVPTSTSIIVCASGATGTGSVFASRNHTIIQ